MRTKIPQGYHVAMIASIHNPFAQDRVVVYRHEDDERHIVADHTLGKIVRRFRNGESAWSNAERWARDYARKVSGEVIGIPNPVQDMDDEEDEEAYAHLKPIRAVSVRR